MTPWLIWSVGCAIFALGTGVLLRALLWDRARGRQRCPNCWYSMEGLTDTPSAAICPECGLCVKRASALFRTRRHWRVASVGLLAMILSATMVAFPFVRAKHWYDIAPDTVLLLTMHQDPGSWTGATRELHNRAAKGSLWNWQERMVIDNLTTSVQSAKNSTQLMPSAFALGRIGSNEASAVPVLIDALSQATDVGIRLTAIEALGSIGDRRATPLLITFVEDETGDHRVTAARALGQIQDPAAAATLYRVLGRLKNSDDHDA